MVEILNRERVFRHTRDGDRRVGTGCHLVALADACGDVGILGNPILPS